MKTRYILLFILIPLLLIKCTAPTHFKSDVDTVKKPWTNLNFNNDPNNFQFGIMSDNTGGSRPGVFENGVKKLNMLQPEFVMCVGDLIAGYSTDTVEIKKQWSDINGTISHLEMPFFYLPGNHDITNKAMAQEWEKLYGKRYYSFVYKNTLFITMDTNDDADFNLTLKQTDFVLNTLKKNPDVRWTFLFMHHPIWKYNTDGRFEKIENALKNRKYTVLAGHEHHYHQAERNGSNYYILSTTGAGSALRGNFAGEFDHISWVTMTGNGPVIANLRLDGILSHDISNDKTDKLAQPLLENTNFNHLILCNKEGDLSNGTLYLSFKNPTDTDLDIHLNFFHHHQLQIEKPEISLHLTAGNNQIVEVPFTALKPIAYNSVDLLRLDWEMKYNHPDYPGFAMHGTYQMTIEPGKTEFTDRPISIFVDEAKIGFIHPYANLESIARINNSPEEKYTKPIQIKESSKISFVLKNTKDEYSKVETRSFQKSEFQSSVEVPKPQPGLNYKYYEGNWSAIPDFTKSTPKSEGIAANLMVQELALRKEFWGISYSGFIRIDEDNLYQFMFKTDDACRLFIDDKIIANEKTAVKGTGTGEIALKKGLHTIKIDYLALKGKPRLRLYLKKYGKEDWEPIGGMHLFH